jgi:hypothetical protein
MEYDAERSSGAAQQAWTDLRDATRGYDGATILTVRTTDDEGRVESRRWDMFDPDNPEQVGPVRIDGIPENHSINCAVCDRLFDERDAVIVDTATIGPEEWCSDCHKKELK